MSFWGIDEQFSLGNLFLMNTLATPPSSPRALHVELATICNLGCAMCVKQSPGWEAPDGLMSKETFLALAPCFPHLEILNLNGVGESLLHPELPDFIRFARSRVSPSCVIGFQSNGMLLTKELARDLVHAGLDRICFSVDSPDPFELGALRSGAVLGQVGDAFRYMRSAAADARRALSVGAQIVVSRGNYLRLSDTVRWCAEHGAEHVIVSHVLPYAQEDALQSLFVQVAERNLDLFRSWQAEFQSDGLDLAQFTRAFYAFVRTPSQQRLVDGAQTMLSEARAKGFEFSLPNILRVDHELLERVGEAFLQSRDVAERLGVRLDLPSLAAREPRHCAFEQVPSLFVAHDGAITPCYFLWHSYSCWPGGERVQVRQRVFGRVGRDDILQVWKGREFSLFREQALQEGYPRCGDCGLTPCDFVQGFPEPFANDCYDISVPCGICPWSGGGFACLH